MVTANGTPASASSSSAGNTQSPDMDAFKQEILQEMRREIQKAKQDIIEGKITNTNAYIVY